MCLASGGCCSESAVTFGGSIADPTYLRRVLELDRTVQTWRKLTCADQGLFRLFQEIKNGAGGPGPSPLDQLWERLRPFFILRCGYVSWESNARASRRMNNEKLDGLRLRAGVDNSSNQYRRTVPRLVPKITFRRTSAAAVADTKIQTRQRSVDRRGETYRNVHEIDRIGVTEQTTLQL
jgi:hypothetical protein